MRSIVKRLRNAIAHGRRSDIANRALLRKRLRLETLEERTTPSVSSLAITSPTTANPALFSSAPSSVTVNILLCGATHSPPTTADCEQPR